ncbi:Molecular chaperone IbpA, HSP20 family [Marininema mesophilum]|uniref:Molecular chaperone IbpA, HSP20 family n=1 Tax=Marininema mesophilum TaxID=1048340 RepID=A0A1H2XNQ2_9BACL|nr:Hsp20/alpha crystallin family protein [Marininema mesophilum]SDW94366.1 Molecular chaperone IbpA, HSP20 family [Marininema mesophilum]
MLRPWLAKGPEDWVGEIFLQMQRLSQELEQNRIHGDFYQKDGMLIVMIEIPGLRERHEIDVRVEGQILIVRGTTGSTDSVEESAFVYEMLLPGKVEVSRMETHADPTDRMLTIRLPLM